MLQIGEVNTDSPQADLAQTSILQTGKGTAAILLTTAVNHRWGFKGSSSLPQRILRFC